MNVSIPTRAKNGYLEITRTDKSGRKVKAREEVITAQGMLTSKEMEREMMQIVDESDGKYTSEQIRITPFQNGEAPIDTNPMHRGRVQMKTFSHGERVMMFSGWGEGKRDRPHA